MVGRSLRKLTRWQLHEFGNVTALNEQTVFLGAHVWPEAIDEFAFEYAISDAGNVKTGAPAGIHDDIVMALALATFTPGRFDPDAKPNPRALLSMLGRPPRPRRAGLRIG